MKKKGWHSLSLILNGIQTNTTSIGSLNLSNEINPDVLEAYYQNIMHYSAYRGILIECDV